ncbi:hypothetical protein ACIO53_05575 [Streptomyces sp. NPDC087305]
MGRIRNVWTSAHTVVEVVTDDMSFLAEPGRPARAKHRADVQRETG